jgi:hypothetical protein
MDLAPYMIKKGIVLEGMIQKIHLILQIHIMLIL